jgi:hypothetical protein
VGETGPAPTFSVFLPSLSMDILWKAGGMSRVRFAAQEPRALWQQNRNVAFEQSRNVVWPIGRGRRFEAFGDAESFYATLARESTHWTRRATPRAYSAISAARPGATKAMPARNSSPSCAALALTPEVCDDHASYIASWLEVLKNDKRAIVRAASYAQRAVDFLHGLQQLKAEAA